MPLQLDQTFNVPLSGAAGRLSRRTLFALLAGSAAAGLTLGSNFAHAQDATSTLVVAGPRTPESFDPEHTSSEADHEARENIGEALLRYGTREEDGIVYQDFNKLVGGLAESWDVSPDKKTIVFHLRKGVKSNNGNEMTADDVMWSFERGWNARTNYYWYMSQVLGITKFEDAFTKIDDYTVQLTIPNPSPFLDRLWVNHDLTVLDSTEIKKHATDDDPWANRWLASNSASFGPYFVKKYTPGTEVVYDANPNYYRGPAAIQRVIFRAMPTSANRVAALQAGSVDVAEYLSPRELSLLEKSPDINIYKVFGNYVHRIEMNNTTEPLNDPRVRQALNYLVPRDEIEKAVYFNTARQTKSPISEIYPAYTDEYFKYQLDVEKAKALLAEAGYPDGFKTELAYRSDDQIEEEIAVILRSAFEKAGVDVSLSKLPASTLAERYHKGDIPMYFFRDMAIVPDAAYVANIWINSASSINYSRYKNDEVDENINFALTSTDEPARLEKMRRVQQLVVEEAPWVFLFNPGYQLATRSNISGYSWYTPNSNAWYDFKKQ